MIEIDMTVLFPQWQGSGQTNEIEYGSKLIGEYFSDILDFKIELRNENYSVKNNIIYYEPIYKQLKIYHDLLLETKPESITTIGGDCGVEIIPISYLNSIYDKVGIIWLDAHADLNTPDSTPSMTFHGMPLRLLMGEGDTEYKALLNSTIASNQLYYIGLRDVDESEKDYIEKNSIFHTHVIQYIYLKTKIQNSKINKVYIHLDLDVIDPLEYRYVKCPTTDGLKIKELEFLILNLQNDFDIIGYSVCESVAINSDQLSPIINILNLIKKGTMHNTRYQQLPGVACAVRSGTLKCKTKNI